MSKIYVIGIGPGAGDQMTVRAANVIKQCPVVVGYTVYVDLLKKDYPDKIYLSTPMRREEARCRMAVEEAGKGQDVAFVCSGDAGVYGMAGLMYEVAENSPEVEIEIIPGITAATGGAAVLGAPLMHDFAVISLSDLMTEWEKIERRLKAAAMADFVICIYNPSSRRRAGYLKKACICMLEYKSEATVCGIVRNIGREGQSCRILSLGELRDTEVDMFTTVFIGNEQTRRIGDKMVTPRGYQIERQSIEAGTER
ncbi:precorrin-3B C(17)-methyltransferase [Roseburia hominis]